MNGSQKAYPFIQKGYYLHFAVYPNGVFKFSPEAILLLGFKDQDLFNLQIPSSTIGNATWTVESIDGRGWLVLTIGGLSDIDPQPGETWYNMPLDYEFGATEPEDPFPAFNIKCCYIIFVAHTIFMKHLQYSFEATPNLAHLFKD